METGEKQEKGVLTKRERQVLLLLRDGRSQREAAKSLFVSTRTVQYHLANAYKKLGVHSLLQALHAARAKGELS